MAMSAKLPISRDMVSRGDPIFPASRNPTSDPMHTKLPEINSTDLQAVRAFLLGTTDEVGISAPRAASKPARHSAHNRAAVPVTHGISRARSRAVKAEG